MISFNKLQLPKKDTLQDKSLIAIAIAPNQHGGYHIGIIHTNDHRREIEANILHLAFHALLQNDSWQGDYAWIVIGLPEPRVRAVAALCRRIWKKYQNDGLPYAFQYNVAFQQDGSLTGKGHGLTCATFVMAVFEAASLSLLDTNSWKSRESDKVWQQSIIAWLNRWPKATSAHIKVLQTELGAVRFRPEEVAGAGLFESSAWPLCFDIATEIGEQLATLVEKHCDPIG